MYKISLIFLFLLSTALFAQHDTLSNKNDSLSPKIESSKLLINPVKWDTLMYRKFDYVFITGLFSQHRDFSNEFEQKINKDTLGLSKQNYVAESNVITGITLSYDKFQVSFGTRSKPRANDPGKGYTKMFSVGFNFGDNRWVSENYYRRFRGFYNKNTNVIDTAVETPPKYYLQPSMVSSLFMSRIMYFTNFQEFSYKSGFGCNYRQLKSAATWVLGASYSLYTLDNDSSLIPMKARALYNDYANMKGLNSYNIGINVGLAGTLVIFKAWFVNGYFTLGPEQQWRNYNMGTYHKSISYVSFSGTGRFSMGLNLKKFYMLFAITNDYNVYGSYNIFSLKSTSTTQNFTFGWRFHSGTPRKFYRKFQETKFYKLFG